MNGTAQDKYLDCASSAEKKTHGQIYDFSIKMRAILFITLAKDTDIEFIATPFRANKDLDNLIQKKNPIPLEEPASGGVDL